MGFDPVSGASLTTRICSLLCYAVSQDIKNQAWFYGNLVSKYLPGSAAGPKSKEVVTTALVVLMEEPDDHLKYTEKEIEDMQKKKQQRRERQLAKIVSCL